MHISLVQNNGQEVVDLKSADLVDGLDFVNGADHRAQTSFLQTLEKVIQFDQIRFKCWRRIDGTDKHAEIRIVINNPQHTTFLSSFKNFIREAESRPKLRSFDASSDISDYAWDWVDDTCRKFTE